MLDQHKDFRAAVIDGRAQAPRFKQRELHKLHAALEKSRSTIITAICNDTRTGKIEAEIQYQQTLSAVGTNYASTDIKGLLADEYKITQSLDNVSRRVPFGYAYIVPSEYQTLYSTVVPLAAAITAGNCVALELKQVYAELNSILRQLLNEALDTETFILVDEDPFEADFAKAYRVHMDGRLFTEAVSTPREIRSPSANVVALVDATADVTQTARELTRARFSFAGRSPYAPDIVLVNEFRMSSLAKALTQEAASYLSVQIDSNGNAIKSVNGHPTKEKALLAELRDAEASFLASGPRGSIAVVHSRESQLLRGKINEPTLILHPISSMDDAIDHVNVSLGTAANPLLAAYFFCAPAAAKYLGQFINARISYTNRIPVELLVGGSAPIGFSPSIQPRYTPEMFSYARSDFISTSDQSLLLAKLLDSQMQGKTTSALSVLPSVVLAPMKETSGKQLGFFEQGFFVGAFCVLTAIVTGSTLTVKYLAPVIIARFR